MEDISSMSTPSSKRPIGLSWRSSTPFIISTIAIGMFTDLFLYGLLVPIFPFLLPDRLHTPPSQIQSQTSILLASYAAAQVILSLPVGFLTDILPTRRIPFLFGLLSLLFSTILLYLGQTFFLLVLARILQGMSAAIVWTIGLAMVLETVGSDRLGETIGGIFGFISIGELVAPVLGGILYDKAGYGAVFALGFALLIVDLVTRLCVIEKKVAETKYGVDFSTPSSASSMAGNSDEESPLLVQDDDGINAPTNALSDHDFRIPLNRSRIYINHPILHSLMHPRTLTALLLIFMQPLSMYKLDPCLTSTQSFEGESYYALQNDTHVQSSLSCGAPAKTDYLLAIFDATLPLHVEYLFGFNSLQSGLLFIPLIGPHLILGPFCGRFVDNYGVKPAAVTGLLTLIPSLILFRLPTQSLVPSHDQTIQISLLCLLLFTSSISLCLLGSPGLVEASFVTEQYHKRNPGLFGKQGPYGKLYAVTSMVYSLGLTIGPLGAGWLRESVGYAWMNIVVAGLCAVVGAVCWGFLGGRPGLLRRREDGCDGEDGEL